MGDSYLKRSLSINPCYAQEKAGKEKKKKKKGKKEMPQPVFYKGQISITYCPFVRNKGKGGGGRREKGEGKRHCMSGGVFPVDSRKRKPLTELKTP